MNTNVGRTSQDSEIFSHAFCSQIHHIGRFRSGIRSDNASSGACEKHSDITAISCGDRTFQSIQLVLGGSTHKFFHRIEFFLFVKTYIKTGKSLEHSREESRPAPLEHIGEFGDFRWKIESSQIHSSLFLLRLENIFSRLGLYLFAADKSLHEIFLIQFGEIGIDDSRFEFIYIVDRFFKFFFLIISALIRRLVLFVAFVLLLFFVLFSASYEFF